MILQVSQYFLGVAVILEHWQAKISPNPSQQ